MLIVGKIKIKLVIAASSIAQIYAFLKAF